VLAIAQAAFATDGLAVRIDDIAARAGLGIGTVYRHFPTKEALLAAIVHARMAALAAAATARVRDPDPGGAFFTFFESMWRDGRHKKDLIAALAGSGIDVKARAAGPIGALQAALATLIHRAQRAGVVRAGIEVADVLALISGAWSAAARTGGDPDRLFAIVRDGLRAPPVASSRKRRRATRS
jgi:AcrR family transcriptional regulator